MAQQIGYIAWTLFIPFFFLGVITLIQFVRFRDVERVQRSVFSVWAIALSLGLWVLVLFARLVERLS